MKTLSKVTEPNFDRFSFRNDFLRIFFIAMVYFLAHAISFFFPDSETRLVLIWPAGGIGLAAFLLNRRQLWPFLTLAFYITGISASVFLGNRSFLAAFGFMTASMVESISCAWFILYFAGDFQKFDRVKEVLLLIAGTVLINAFSSCIGAYTSVLASGASFGVAWWSWYISDGLGLLLIGPLIVSWTHKPKDFLTGLHLKKIVESIVFLIVWFIISYIIFYLLNNVHPFVFHPYMLVALLVWPAIRFGMKGVTLTLLIFFIIALVSPAIVNGPSPWVGQNPNLAGRLLELELFLVFLAIVGYMISAGYTSLIDSKSALRQSEEKFRILFENSGTGIVTVGIDGKYLIVNEESARQFGLPSNEIVGKSIFDLLPLPTAQKYLEKNKILIETGGIREYEDSFVLNGTTKVFLIVDQVLKDKNGNNYAIQSSSIEITERKKVEKDLVEYRQLFSLFMKYSPVYTFIKEVTSTESRVLQASENYSEMIGIPGSEMIGKTMEQLFPPEFAANISADDWAVVSNGKILQLDEELNGRIYTSIKFPIILEGKNILAGYTIDNTEQKQSEKQLGESEANARAIMESTDDVLLLLDKEGIVIDCNEAHAKRLNTTRNELLGKNVFDRLPNDVANSRREHIHTVISTGKPIYSQDFRGGYWNEFVIHPIYTEDKITERVAIFARDITERKQAEQALRESEARFRNLLQDVRAVSVQGYAPNGTTQYWNQASEQLYGYTREEAIGKNLLELIIPTEMREDTANAIRQMGETGQPIPSSELSLLRKDGSLVTVFSSHTIVKSPGKPQELFCIDIDLTELKRAEKELSESEEKFREMANLLPQIIFESDAEGKLIYVNKQAFIILGYPEDYPIIGLNTLDFYTPESRLKAIENIRGRLSGKLKDDSNEYVMIRKNGSTFPALVYSNPILKDNKPVGLRGIIVDITDQKQFEAEIKLKNENLIQLIATKDKFFSIIAHDLKSPFNSILGFSELLIEMVRNKDYQALEEYAAIIQKSSKRAMDLLSNLLVWSRSQTGRIEFNPEYVEIGSLINATADLLNDTAKQKSITISNECQQNVIAFADKDMIGTILRNLISNAIKFTHPGGKVVLSAEKKKDKIEISVSDNGVGIKKEDIGKLFRIDENHSTKGTQNEGGTGLGLLLCKEFVEKHGGKMLIESEPGLGSKFCFTIPLK